MRHKCDNYRTPQKCDGGKVECELYICRFKKPFFVNLWFQFLKELGFLLHCYSSLGFVSETACGQTNKSLRSCCDCYCFRKGDFCFFPLFPLLVNPFLLGVWSHQGTWQKTHVSVCFGLQVLHANVLIHSFHCVFRMYLRVALQLFQNCGAKRHLFYYIWNNKTFCSKMLEI